MTTPIQTFGSTSAVAATSPTANDAGSADRFLKLLVAQMQNQDPLNPMDNAQVTTQMAQISTVSGIEGLNKTVQALNGQFTQMQALQGAALVGRDVTVPGNQLVPVNGRAEAGFELNGSAESVKVEVLNGAGQPVHTIDLGALPAGRHGFDWDGTGATDLAGHTFRVQASVGSASISATPLMLDRVRAVATGAEGLTLDLERSGTVAYANVRAIN